MTRRVLRRVQKNDNMLHGWMLDGCSLSKSMGVQKNDNISSALQIHILNQLAEIFVGPRVATLRKCFRFDLKGCCVYFQCIITASV